MLVAKPFILLLLVIFYPMLLVLASPYQIINEKSPISHEDDEEIIQRSMFPKYFVFGVATSAYQVEGAYLEDGKGLSNWDVFSHTPGGRFGKINPSGITFYNKIIDNLLLKGIEPFLTIHHFDYPHELEERYGGWLSPLMQDDFVHFAKICFEEFGDRVKYWVTINEPNIHTYNAYVVGTFPPAHCSPPFGNCSAGDSDVEPLIVVHNMLLAHGKAVHLYRHQFQPKQHGYIGIVAYTASYIPYRDDNFGRQAVERAYTNLVAWILDPVIYGEYPTLMRKYHGKELPKFTKEEVKLIKGSVDFIGINHYTTLYAIDCFHYSSECTSQYNRPIQGFVKATGVRDDIPIGEQAGNVVFYVVPEGMELIMDYIRVRYPNISIYITENGYAPPTLPNALDILQDFKRIQYLRTYIAALSRAIRKGAKVKGYFAWSFMDNFEWDDGYEPTYGLYYVDRTTQKRVAKLSAKWYAGFLANHDLLISDTYVTNGNVLNLKRVKYNR